MGILAPAARMRRSSASKAARVVIVFGVSLATVITLFLIPLIYSRLAGRTGSPNAISRKLEKELAA